MATSRDVQEIISKLSSDKPKTREEGIRLLNSWLEGERSFSLCRLLAKNTAKIGPDEIPHEESWSFLLTLLTKCIALEISACKKRHPKLLLAKTLRIVIQCAEDRRLSGLLLLYMNKVVSTVSVKRSLPSSSKEEVFRCAQTLHVLLENPPGDFPDNIRENLVTGFIETFSSIRDEGKYSRKLMECINTYLMMDGHNLGELQPTFILLYRSFFFNSGLRLMTEG